MAVIAMTREMATRGSEVAAGLADRLGLAIIHHEIVEHDIAERTGMPESEVHRFSRARHLCWSGGRSIENECLVIQLKRSWSWPPRVTY